jgi:hypothetical protein
MSILWRNLVTAQNVPKGLPFVRRFSIRGVAVFTFFPALWFGLWWRLSGKWSVNDQYSYGWFVSFFAILLFWLRWEDAPKAQDVRGQKEGRICDCYRNRNARFAFSDSAV